MFRVLPRAELWNTKCCIGGGKKGGGWEFSNCADGFRKGNLLAYWFNFLGIGLVVLLDLFLTQTFPCLCEVEECFTFRWGVCNHSFFFQ